MTELSDHPDSLLLSAREHFQPQPTDSGWSVRYVFVVITLCAVLAALFLGWYQDLRWRTDILSTRVQRLDERWTIVAADVDVARTVQTRYEAFLNKAKCVIKEGEAKRWTPALRIIAVSTITGIQLREIRVVPGADHSHAYGLQIDGLATGSEARALADKFLQILQSELGRQFQLTEPCKFEWLEDQKDSIQANANHQKATFTITTTIALTESKTG